MSERAPWWATKTVYGALGTAALAVIVDAVLWRVAGPAPELVLFVGRFHPLVVHLPIGVFVLAGALESLTLFPSLRKRIDPVTPIVLFAILVSGVMAFVMGHLLAKAGGFPAQSLVMHRRLTLAALVVGALATAVWARRSHGGREGSRAPYRLALGIALGLLSIGAHFGGNMTHGETYLTRYAPGPIRAILEPSATREAKPAERGAQSDAVSAEPRLFADVVAPILEAKCASCHGAESAKGGLRVDALEHLLRGGDGGPAMVPGSGASSLLVTRMRLPASDDEHMPPEGRVGPTAEEVAVVAFWIDRGANETLRVRDALAPAEARTVLESVVARGAAASPPASVGVAPATSTTPGAAADPPAAPAPGAPASSAPVAWPAGPGSVAATEGGGLAWEERVHPILQARCESCHGPTKQKGKLRVDTREAVFAGGKAGTGIVPGSPESSTVVSRALLAIDHPDHMPPAKEVQLAEEELATLVAWVKKGAGAELRVADLGVASIGPPRSAKSPAAPAPAVASEAPHGATDATKPVTVAVEATAADGDAASMDAALRQRLPREVQLYPSAVKPILTRHCGACHTGDRANAGFRVDDDAKLVAGGDGGPAVVRGDPAGSLLLARMVLPVDDDEHMPPASMGQPSPGEIALVRAWIAAGARPETVVETRSLGQGAGVALAAVLAPTASPSAAPQPGADAARGRAKVDTIPVQSAGCASCAVGGAVAPPTLALLLSGMGLGGLVLRRRRRRAR